MTVQPWSKVCHLPNDLRDRRPVASDRMSIEVARNVVGIYTTIEDQSEADSPKPNTFLKHKHRDEGDQRSPLPRVVAHSDKKWKGVHTNERIKVQPGTP